MLNPIPAMLIIIVTVFVTALITVRYSQRISRMAPKRQAIVLCSLSVLAGGVTVAAIYYQLHPLPFLVTDATFYSVHYPGDIWGVSPSSQFCTEADALSVTDYFGGPPAPYTWIIPREVPVWRFNGATLPTNPYFPNITCRHGIG